jgi:phosphoribosylglycinamide formyltransferase-1
MRVATTVVDHRQFESGDAFDAALAAAIDASEPDLIVMAGFMRILGRAFIERYAGRMLNIHPSLLPAYTGLHTHRRALADGVRIHGCTVHFVTHDLDSGPIVAQGAVAVRDDDEATLAFACSRSSIGCGCGQNVLRWAAGHRGQAGALKGDRARRRYSPVDG